MLMSAPLNRILVLVIACLAFWSMPGSGAQYEEGVHYQILDPQAPLSTSGEGIEVSEYFSYGCGHCFQFDPVLTAWLETLPKDVVLIERPPFGTTITGTLRRLTTR